MRLLFLSLWGLLLSGASFAQSGSEYIASPFDWIVPTELPQFPDHRIDAVDNGIAYYLVDDQAKVLDNGYEFHYRLAYQVIDRSGLEEAAQITVSFDPSESHIAFTDLSIIRDGVRTQRLNDTDIEIIRQEEDLANNIVDGQLTAVINIEGLKTGDIVDYAYQGMYDSELWPGHYFGRQTVEWSVPLAQLNYRLLAPRETEIVHRFVETDLELTVLPSGELVEYAFTALDAEPVTYQSSVPVDFVQYGFLDVSTMSTWTDVASWGLSMYEVDWEIPADLRDVLSRIIAENETAADRAIAALRYVQSEIRYLGLQGGIGSHKPRPPMLTLSRGYGDCKDKTVLLMVMLRELGIDARAALANVTSGHQLDQRLPSIGAFDHVLVQIELDGKAYWLDPTLSHQGGNLATLTQPDYGFVLPIQSGGSALRPIDIVLSEEPARETLESFMLPEEGDIGFELDVTTKYTGYAADDVRVRVAYNSRDQLQRDYLDYYNRLYPGILVRDRLDIVDDLERNEIVIKEYYQISREDYEAGEIDDQLWMLPEGIRGQLAESVEANRFAPLALPFGVNVEHTIEYITPGRMFASPESIELEDLGIFFAKSYEASGERFRTIFRMRVTERSVPLSDVPTAIELAERIDEETNLFSTPGSASPTFARRLNLSEPLQEDIEQRLVELNALIVQDKNRQALAAASRLIRETDEEGPLLGYLLILKGAIEIDLDRPKPAMASLKKGFELHTPSVPSIYFNYATLLRRDDQDVEAAKIVIKLFEEHPEAISSVNFDWLRELSWSLYDNEEIDLSDQLDRAAAIAQYEHREAFEVQPWLYSSAIRPMVANGEEALAALFLDEIVNPNTLVNLSMDKRVEPLWDQIDQKIGDVGLPVLTNRFVDLLRDKADEDPNDFETQLRLMNAFRQAGQYEEALNLGATVLEDWESIEAYGEEAQWFVDEYARALMDLGQYDEAISVTKKLLEPGLDADPNLINFAINFSLRQWQAGRYDAAQESARRLLDADENYSSDYGTMFIYQAIICSLADDGELDAAKSMFDDEAKTFADSNFEATLSIRVCTGELQAAEELLIDQLGSIKSRSTALSMFTTPTVGWRDPSSLRAQRNQTYVAILSKPRIQDALAQYGREVKVDGPAEFWGAH